MGKTVIKYQQNEITDKNTNKLNNQIKINKSLFLLKNNFNKTNINVNYNNMTVKNDNIRKHI